MTKLIKKPITETHSREILDSIADGVFTVNPDMKITFLNRAAEKITGVSQLDAIGQYCFEVLRSNICETSCPMRNSLTTGKDYKNRHVNILNTDGKQVPINISTSVLKDERDNIVGGVETFRDFSTIEALRKEIKQSYTFEDIVSKNDRVLKIFSILPEISESDTTVLIQGSSGSGKELFARAIHNLSNRKNKPFIAVNCGALPDNLLESELFGYIKGAFTDAKKDKPGRFALARGGTIFLDEVESLSPATQVKLLRVLQEKEFEPLGATSPIKSDVRIISATKINLLDLVNKNEFRDDLFYRLNIVKIELPSLTERRDDIPLLINHFIEKFNHRMGKYITNVSSDVLEILMTYNYKGNIRELENIIEHAFVMCQNEEIQINHLPLEIYSSPTTNKNENTEVLPLEKIECQSIMESLERHKGNKVEVAKELKLHRTTLWRKMKKYGLI